MIKKKAKYIFYKEWSIYTYIHIYIFFLIFPRENIFGRTLSNRKMERERNDRNSFLFFFKSMFFERYAYVIISHDVNARMIIEIILKTLFDDNYIVLRMRINTRNVE